DLAQQHESHRVADTEARSYPGDAEDVESHEHAAEVKIERRRWFRKWFEAAFYGEKKNHRNAQRYQEQDRGGKCRASVPGAESRAQSGHDGNSDSGCEHETRVEKLICH